MTMPRLSETVLHKLDTFHQCQLCGLKSDDICEFRLWAEMEEDDTTFSGPVVMLCEQDRCKKILGDHPRLYREVPWGAGKPGHFLFLCEECPHRSEWRCSHPHLKSNGGEGLLVEFNPHPLGGIHVSFSNGTGGFPFSPQAATCEGHPEKKPEPDQ